MKGGSRWSVAGGSAPGGKCVELFSEVRRTDNLFVSIRGSKLGVNKESLGGTLVGTAKGEICVEVLVKENVMYNGK